MEDALLAQLLGMGFDSEDIQACQRELSAQGGYSLQAATEWLLQRQQQLSAPHQGSSGRLVLTTPTVAMDPGDVRRPLSSTSDLTTQSKTQNQPLKSRYNLGDDHSRDKDRFAAKERGEAVKRARMRRMEDMKAKLQLKQQIADDRKAKQEKLKSPTEPTAPCTLQDTTPTPQSHDSQVTKSHDTCRVQVRLPDGKVLRQNFSPSASLGDVAEFVVENCPEYSNVQLVQPFPHYEFSNDEYRCSLQSLNLCPSASLVVSKHPKQEVGGASSKPHLQTEPGSIHDAKSRPTPFEHNQITAASSHIPKRRIVTFDSGRRPEYRVQNPEDKGHRLGGGEPSEEEDENQPNEIGGDENQEDDISDEESIDDEVPQPPRIMPHPPGIIGGNAPLPLAQGGPPLPGQVPMGRHFPPPGGAHLLGMGANRVVPGGAFQGLGVRNDTFEGDGHRLGGKEGPVMLGDLQRHADRMRDAARSAAMKRYQATPLTSHTSHTLTDRGPPSLESLSTRALITASRSYFPPSCSGLTPLVAQKLIKVLKDEKRLIPKTLAAFHGCPVQVINLDNYIYATNELLQALCFFPSLTQLSLVSCTIVTDKAIMALLPYLTGLTHLNLNGCRQLNEIICRDIRCCTHLEVLNLSEVKVTDRGISLLVNSPLVHLRELDLSKTQITSKALDLLSAGTPNLESLNIEGTSVDRFNMLSQLPHLHTLNIAHCPTYSDVGTLSGCRGLHTLSLVGLSVETGALEQLISGLQLKSLKLPDRNTFFDDGLKIVSEFPLSSLNLMDYCHVTNMGISHVCHMNSLSVLSLSRTKLTDQGMPYIEGLSGLRELSIDNTLVSDVGMTYVSRLTGLDVLSLSDTKVTSQFILNGLLDGLHMLTKLNISRTAVCDRGVTRLRLSSLIMLNINWTCATEQSSLEFLRGNGCPLLEVLGNSNIGQPLPGQPSRADNNDN